MTVATRPVTFTPLVLDGVGAPAVATGYYLITPTASYLDGVGRVAPLPLQVVIDGVAVATDLPVTGTGWALKVVGHLIGLTGETSSTTEYVTVPAGTGGLDFEDLPRVDPTTLATEITPPDPAWWAALTAIGKLVTDIPVMFAAPTATTGVTASDRAYAARTLTGARMRVAGAPVGSSLIVQVQHFDGSSWATLGTLTITTGSTVEATATFTQAQLVGNLVRLNITSVGSTTAASGVAVDVIWH